MAVTYIDEKQIRQSIATFKGGQGNGLFEARIIKGKKNPMVGYFKDVNVIIDQLRRQDLRGTNVYMVLNEINDACYSKKAKDKFLMGEQSTTDKEIIGRQWILIDLDPVRPSGVSASDDEIAKAKKKAQEIYTFLLKQGFTEPVIGFSGNGYHLLYKVLLANTPEHNERIKRFLATLDALFSDGDIKIDTSNFNPSRVCKMYGTLAQKGSNTEDRPHRMSALTYIPKAIIPVDQSYIDKVNEIIPDKPDAPQRYNNYNGERFDLEAWMQKHGLHYKASTFGDGKKYILDHCPFDSSHNGKDAAILQRNNGAICFHCFHDSCQDKGWKDVRIMFEPDAYERKWQAEEQRMYGHHNRDRKQPPKPLEETSGNPIWLTPMDVYNMPDEDVHYIKTGYTDIDQKMYGLKKKAVSVLTGLRSAGKSTWIDGLILNAIQDGNTVGCYSGELAERDFMYWMIRQAAGRNGVEVGRYEGQWNVPKKNKKLISEWLQGKFYLYNNSYGNDYRQIHDEIKRKIDKDKLDLVVIDNLMALDIDGLSMTQWDAQKKFVIDIHRLAVEMDVHIMFVAHPRKTVSFLRLEDISGSGDLANAVDDAFLIHRNNEDFKIRSREMFKWGDDHIAYSGTNVIEIAKDRWTGIQDWFIPLFYEPETKRLKNSMAENILYGWRTEEEHESDGFMDIPDGYEPDFS